MALVVVSLRKSSSDNTIVLSLMAGQMRTKRNGCYR
jgi:hypothetical protein